jgi:hypothetical protein
VGAFETLVAYALGGLVPGANAIRVRTAPSGHSLGVVAGLDSDVRATAELIGLAAVHVHAQLLTYELEVGVVACDDLAAPGRAGEPGGDQRPVTRAARPIGSATVGTLGSLPYGP